MGIGRLLKLVAIALAVVLPVRTWVAEPVYVASPSMEPALKTGTLLILDKVTLITRSPRRGDILSFRSPIGEKHDLLKRVKDAYPQATIKQYLPPINAERWPSRSRAGRKFSVGWLRSRTRWLRPSWSTRMSRSRWT